MKYRHLKNVYSSGNMRELKNYGFYHLVECSFTPTFYNINDDKTRTPVFDEKHQWLRDNFKNKYKSTITRRYAFYKKGTATFFNQYNIKCGVAFKTEEDALAFMLRWA